MDTKGKSLYKLEQVASERQVSFKGGLETKTFQVWGQRNMVEAEYPWLFSERVPTDC